MFKNQNLKKFLGLQTFFPSIGPKSRITLSLGAFLQNLPSKDKVLLLETYISNSYMVEFHDDFAQVFEKIVGDYHSKSPFLALLLEEGGDNKFIKFLKAKNTQSVDNENQEFIRLQITDWDQKGMEFYWFLI